LAAAYCGTADGTPRLIPGNFLWIGEELVIGAFAGTYESATCAPGPTWRSASRLPTAPQALMLRGKAIVTDVEGVRPEYAAMPRAVMGEEAWGAYLEAIDQPGLQMVRIGPCLAWVGAMDLQERFPERTRELVLAASGASR
jgi:hypothetical protein